MLITMPLHTRPEIFYFNLAKSKEGRRETEERQKPERERIKSDGAVRQSE